MTFFSADAAQAVVDLELAALAWLFHSLPLGALVLLAAVVVAVSWLSWAEVRDGEACRLDGFAAAGAGRRQRGA